MARRCSYRPARPEKKLEKKAEKVLRGSKKALHLHPLSETRSLKQLKYHTYQQGKDENFFSKCL